MSYYIQIGAGAGDQDERLNYKEGFTNFIKKKTYNKDDKVLVVEANPLNIDKLKSGSGKWDRTTDLGLMSPAPSPFSTFLYHKTLRK